MTLQRVSAAEQLVPFHRRGDSPVLGTPGSRPLRAQPVQLSLQLGDPVLAAFFPRSPVAASSPDVKPWLNKSARLRM
jgi:hypothetical protein